MKNKILERYEKNSNEELIISISSEKIEDLYSNFDEKSSFIKKDLNINLEKYLIESVEEIGNHPFIIRFYFTQLPKNQSDEKLKKSIKDYFEYLLHLEQKKLQEQLKNSFIFIFIGFVFISISLFLGEDERFIIKLLAEGSMVGGWVSLWEAMATILIKWLPHKKKVKILNKISLAKIELF